MVQLRKTATKAGIAGVATIALQFLAMLVQPKIGRAFGDDLLLLQLVLAFGAILLTAFAALRGSRWWLLAVLLALLTLVPFGRWLGLH